MGGGRGARTPRNKKINRTRRAVTRPFGYAFLVEPFADDVKMCRVVIGQRPTNRRVCRSNVERVRWTATIVRAACPYAYRATSLRERYELLLETVETSKNCLRPPGRDVIGGSTTSGMCVWGGDKRETSRGSYVTRRWRSSRSIAAESATGRRRRRPSNLAWSDHHDHEISCMPPNV